MHFIWEKLALLKCEYLANGLVDFDDVWCVGKLTFWATIVPLTLTRNYKRKREKNAIKVDVN